MPGEPLNLAHTPQLKRFARESMSFRNCISNYPVCSLYRAMLQTGRCPDEGRSVVYAAPPSWFFANCFGDHTHTDLSDQSRQVSNLPSRPTTSRRKEARFVFSTGSDSRSNRRSSVLPPESPGPWPLAFGSKPRISLCLPS